MSRVSKTSYLDEVTFLIENKIPHAITTCGRTHTLKSILGTSMYAPDCFSFEALGFINRVRNHILKEKTYENIHKGERRGLKVINMTGVELGAKKNEAELFNNCVEFDLNKAYWNGAVKVGAISNALYREGIDGGFSKTELLASIGTMAKTVRERSFDGEKYLPSVTLTDSELTRHIWQEVSWEIDRCMQACAKALGREEFLFYWTDAVFFHNTAANKALVADVIKIHGFEYKEQKIECLTRDATGQIIAWTREKKGRAKNEQVLRDAKRNYGRIFCHIEHKDAIMAEVAEYAAKYKASTAK